MFEKVNPCHPDKLADRIAGALVDMAYAKETDPRIAVEVLIGHGVCHIIAETSVTLPGEAVTEAVHRIAGNLTVDYKEVPQDGHLADNQADGVHCGDNGIFKGVPVTDEQPRTVGKRTFINVGNAAKIDFAKGLTAAESPAIDMRYTVRHMVICSDRTVCCTQKVRMRQIKHNAVFHAEIRIATILYQQILASGKRIVSDAVNVFCQNDAPYSFAVPERISADLRNTFRYGQAVDLRAVQTAYNTCSESVIYNPVLHNVVWRTAIKLHFGAT